MCASPEKKRKKGGKGGRQRQRKKGREGENSNCDLRVEVVVFTPYKGQLRLHQKLHGPNIVIATVDAAQGKEYDFLILDLVTPGQEYSLGFLSDPKRMNVALSRAKIGLLVVGDRHMAEVPFPTEGSRNWDELVARHQAHVNTQNGSTDIHRTR